MRHDEINSKLREDIQGLGVERHEFPKKELEEKKKEGILALKTQSCRLPSGH